MTVAAKVLSLSGTFTRDEVAAQFSGEVSRATVYRTINALINAELIREVKFNDQSVFVVRAEPNT